jgi:phthalate 4,5-dioxygenase
MLSAEQNALLTSVEPGSPMNAALKRYWLPAARSADVAERDSDPIRLTLLSESYVLFRDSSGTAGVLKEGCCHRNASLVLGRVEDGGIRCLFHGWKFAVDGRLLEMPNCNDERVMQRLRQRAFPIREVAGLIWVYLGPPELEPPFPHFPFMDVPPDHVYVEAPTANANFVQLIEGLVDSSHVGILHSDPLRRALNPMLQPETGTVLHRQMISNSAPEILTQDADFGFRSVAIRAESDGEKPVTIARITAFAAPVFGYIASGWTVVAAVPVTSTRTTFFHIFWDANEPLIGARLETLRAYYGLDDRALYEWGLAAAARDLPTAANRANNFHQDRAAMRRGETFTGIHNFVPEDIAMAESQGAVCDRSDEHLIAADAGIARARRLLLDAANAVAAGNEPPGLRPAEIPVGIQGPVPSPEAWPTLLTHSQPEVQHA